MSFLVSLPLMSTLPPTLTVLKSTIPTMICTSLLDPIFTLLIKVVSFNSTKLVTTSSMSPKTHLLVATKLMPTMMKMSNSTAVTEVAVASLINQMPTLTMLMSTRES
ncbi:hypothetical protein H8356DRAFT_1687438 [Neocallimastix lanati (nom. inval.)]|nr:hypothetical protein H8356DRAFT_1687438 [Neocallimastix sp. JGI-2020a]